MTFEGATELGETRVLVVLGAPNDEQGRLLPAALARAEMALQEYHRDPRFALLPTGGFGEHFNVTARPHFEYLAAHFEQAGLPKAAILGGVASRNTVEDARLCAEFLAERPGPLHLKVVTSDFHLARARLLFAHAFGQRARLHMVAAPPGLARDELVRALRHEADAIGRLAL